VYPQYDPYELCPTLLILLLIISPQVPSAATVASSAEVVVTTETAVDEAMVEIPFVPAPLRQTVKAKVIDDTIVVVGQRQKKRKRSKKYEKTDISGVETPSTPTGDIKAELDIVPFDFASAPNILDDGPSELNEQKGGRGGKRRRSKTRSGRLSFGSFSRAELTPQNRCPDQCERCPDQPRSMCAPALSSRTGVRF